MNTPPGPEQRGDPVPIADLASILGQSLAVARAGAGQANPLGETRIAALETASSLISLPGQSDNSAGPVAADLLRTALGSARATVGALSFALAESSGHTHRSNGPATTGEPRSQSTSTARAGREGVHRNAWHTGSGSSPIHHGEIIQGAFRVGGRIRRGLVTLPCQLYHSRAEFRPMTGAPVTVRPEWRAKARRAAELTVREIEAVLGAGLGGVLTVASDVPLCRGFGSSTSDVLATIRAVTDAFALTFPPETVARLAVRAETASDSLMFGEHAVLFAHREGEIIEDFGHRLPPIHVVGFGTGEGVDTLASLPARYSRYELDTFDELRGLLRAGLTTGDLALIGQVATVSTRINQSYLPVPELDRVSAIAREAGAVGVHTAHSGDIAGILFDRSDPDLEHRAETAQKLLRALGFSEQWRFSADD